MADRSSLILMQATTIFFGLVLFGSVLAGPVDDPIPERVARIQLTNLGVDDRCLLDLPIVSISTLDGQMLCYVFSLEPVGFIVVSADDDLPPVIAYSLRNGLPLGQPERDQWVALIRADLAMRLEYMLDAVDSPWQDRWQRLLDGEIAENSKRRFEQWPPAGTTSTGGWLETNWHQNAPYNDVCPMDPVTAVRSVAGCPAVAMAQILNYHETTNDTQFSDVDDYYHAYAGRNYWIDDDHAIHDFASFPELSTSLDALQSRYQGGVPIEDGDRAALTFACGVAAHQVYTSSVSGTFGVDQAVQAYERFGVSGFELLGETHPDLFTRMADNMKNALPVHFAVLSATGSGGHNVVVDGYNSDGYFHLNFGWGGSANGWYLLPDEIPYNLTVVEGAIVDIYFSDLIFADGFESGDCSLWSTMGP